MTDDTAITHVPFYRRRVPLIGIGVILGVLLLLLIDIVTLSLRLTSRSVAFPQLDDGIETWVIAGSDNRSSLPTGATAAQLAAPPTYPALAPTSLLSSPSAAIVSRSPPYRVISRCWSRAIRSG